MELPPHFIQTVSATFPGGAAWLQNLPALLDDCARRYDLTLSPTPFALSFNYVVPARRNANGQEIVLKVGVPNGEMTTEAAALHVWNGTGAVRLLDADEEKGVLLLEHLRPGTMLSAWWPDRDDEATEIAASVMRGLWPTPDRKADYPALYAPPFLSVGDWARALGDANANNAPPALLPLIWEARGVFADLLADTPQGDVVLLHGDLHHFNIVQDGPAAWRAIDPKGVWGDRAYEAGALLRNPWPGLLHHANPQTLLHRRLAILADVLGLPREKLRLWAWASAVLSAWWSVQNSLPNGGDGWQHSTTCAELLKGATLPATGNKKPDIL